MFIYWWSIFIYFDFFFINLYLYMIIIIIIIIFKSIPGFLIDWLSIDRFSIDWTAELGHCSRVFKFDPNLVMIVIWLIYWLGTTKRLCMACLAATGTLNIWFDSQKHYRTQRKSYSTISGRWCYLFLILSHLLPLFSLYLFLLFFYSFCFGKLT